MFRLNKVLYRLIGFVPNFRLSKIIPLNEALQILVFTNAMILLAGAMFGPVNALFVEKIGGDLLDASFAAAAFSLAAGLTTIISGKYSDRIKNSSLLIVIGYSVMTVGFLLHVFVASVWTLLIAQLIIGFGEAIYSPAFNAVYSRHIEKKKEASQWSIWEATYHLSVAVGAVIGGVIVTKLGFNALFIIMTFLSAASAIYIFSVPKDTL